VFFSFLLYAPVPSFHLQTSATNRHKPRSFSLFAELTRYILAGRALEDGRELQDYNVDQAQKPLIYLIVRKQAPLQTPDEEEDDKPNAGVWPVAECRADGALSTALRCTEGENGQISSGDAARARAVARFQHLEKELKTREFEIQVLVCPI
jgi:hypothetical protein